jgi:hypothetical protein
LVLGPLVGFQLDFVIVTVFVISVPDRPLPGIAIAENRHGYCLAVLA